MYNLFILEAIDNILVTLEPKDKHWSSLYLNL